MLTLYVVARVADQVLHAEYDEKAMKEIEMILTEDVTLDILVYSCDSTPINHYREKLGDGIVPFALQLYGTIKAKSQGVQREHYEDYITKLHEHLGIQEAPRKDTKRSIILPD